MLIKLIVGSALIAAPHWLHAATACEDKAAGGQYAYVVKTSNVDDGRSEGQDVVVKRAKVVVGEAVQPEYAITVDGQNQAPARVIINGAAIDSDNSVFVGEDGTVEHVKVFEMKSADGQPGSMMVKVLGGDGATSHVELAQAVNRKGGWLGVSIKGAAEDSGVEVLNVIKDSPAEEAGLLAGDVILEVDGDEVANDVPLAVSAISSHEPGDEVEVVVLRDGRERSFDVVLGSRKDIKNFEWKFDTAPFAEIEENVAIKGKMLLKDEDGEWVFKSLDNLEQIEDIHNEFKLDLPGSFGNMTQVWVDGEQKTVKLEIKIDDSSISIQQEDGGEITVTRIDEDGNEDVEVYEDEDQLRDEDPEAFKHYTASGKPVVIGMNIDGMEGLANIDFSVELEEVEEMFNWKHDLHEHLMDAKEAYAEAMEEAKGAYEEAMVEWHEQLGDGDQDWPAMLHGHLKNVMPMVQQAAKPKHRFTITESGAIEVTIRSGDSELVRRFADEDDLARRSPGLYDKFEDLLVVEEDAE